MKVRIKNFLSPTVWYHFFGGCTWNVIERENYYWTEDNFAISKDHVEVLQEKPSTRRLKIQITSAVQSPFEETEWYKDCMGAEFEVVEIEGNSRYVVAGDHDRLSDERVWRWIRKNNCTVLPLLDWRAAVGSLEKSNSDWEDNVTKKDLREALRIAEEKIKADEAKRNLERIKIVIDAHFKRK